MGPREFQILEKVDTGLTHANPVDVLCRYFDISRDLLLGHLPPTKMEVKEALVPNIVFWNFCLISHRCHQLLPGSGSQTQMH
jgi:hypothetical protein